MEDFLTYSATPLLGLGPVGQTGVLPNSLPPSRGPILSYGGEVKPSRALVYLSSFLCFVNQRVGSRSSPVADWVDSYERWNISGPPSYPKGSRPSPLDGAIGQTRDDLNFNPANEVMSAELRQGILELEDAGLGSIISEEGDSRTSATTQTRRSLRLESRSCERAMDMAMAREATLREGTGVVPLNVSSKFP